MTSYEKEVIQRFQGLVPTYQGDFKDNDTTALLLAMIAKTKELGVLYTDYYLSQLYSEDSYLNNKLFGYSNLKINPRVLKVSCSMYVDTISPEEVLVPIKKFTSFTDEYDQEYLLLDSIVVSNFGTIGSLSLIEGHLQELTVLSSMITTTSQPYILGIENIIPDVGKLVIDDVEYQNSLSLAKYSDTELAYGIDILKDGRYQLIFSKELLKHVHDYSRITLSCITLDESYDQFEIFSLQTDPIIYNNQEYNIRIDQVLMSSFNNYFIDKSHTLDFETNVSDEDYQTNVDLTENILMSKIYDIKDIVTGSIIELDPENPEIDLYSEDRKSPLPFYSIVAIAASSNWTRIVKQQIMNQISRGLISKELLLDYGSFKEVSPDNGSSVNPDFRPYMLPEIVNSNNNRDFDYENEGSFPGYNMPDVVFQVIPAKYIPIDITIFAELSQTVSNEDLVNLYLRLIDNIKSFFKISSSNENIDFNMEITKDQILNVLYQSDMILEARIKDFVYYRNSEKSESVDSIQLSPLELPVLGKLNLNLQYLFKSDEDYLQISDLMELTSAKMSLFENLNVTDDLSRLKLSLDDEFLISDELEFIPELIKKTNLNIIYNYVFAAQETSDSLIDFSGTGSTVVRRTIDKSPIIDSASYSDDKTLEDNGIVLDYKYPYDEKYDF